MSVQDLPATVKLSQEFGWPHRVEDWRFALDAGGGIVAETNEGIIGSAMGWRYGDNVGSVGMIIVTRRAQGLGLGRLLLEQILHANAGHVIFLNGTEGGCQGEAKSLGLPMAIGEIRPIGPDDLPTVAAFDASAIGYDRSMLLEALSGAGQCIGVYRQGKLAGYALCRHFGRGHVVGPVIADDAEVARQLIRHCLALHAGSFVRIDIANHREIVAFVEAAGLLPELAPVHTMVRNGPTRPVLLKARPRLVAMANQAFG
jgi:ribosomal protein S18 acetylase RimI-like enzyme